MSSAANNYTASGFNIIRDGFNPDNPLVGTETHEFTFQNDPWMIKSKDNKLLLTFTNIILSVSKIYNPNNTTESFMALSWSPEYFYQPTYSDAPSITLTLKDKNSAILGSFKLDALESRCGKSPIQSRKSIIDAFIFDRIAAAAFTLGESAWTPC